jgi:energy-coupling factor transport system permease protein
MQETFLGKLDPRFKLILLPLLITATFSAESVTRLFLLSCAALWLSRSEGDTLLLLWQVVRPLRVLLLVTLLMHLCFSSGWTLFGQTWLSLDGLKLGLLTCWRLLVAVLFAVLLTRTTPPEKLAAALGILLSPLQRLGLRVAAMTEFLLLTLTFIPRLQQQFGARATGAMPTELGAKPLVERLRGLMARIEPLVLGFADQAETLATRLAQGEQIVKIPELGPLAPLPGGWLVLVGCVFLVILAFAL